MDTDQQKQRLLEEKALLEKEMNSLGQEVADGDFVAVPPADDGVHADEIDNADTTEDFENRVATLKPLEEKYAHVNKALAAIENSSYGNCEVCNIMIPHDRLQVLPSATTCIEHA